MVVQKCAWTYKHLLCSAFVSMGTAVQPVEIASHITCGAALKCSCGVTAQILLFEKQWGEKVNKWSSTLQIVTQPPCLLWEDSFQHLPTRVIATSVSNVSSEIFLQLLCWRMEGSYLESPQGDFTFLVILKHFLTYLDGWMKDTTHLKLLPQTLSILTGRDERMEGFSLYQSSCTTWWKVCGGEAGEQSSPCILYGRCWAGCSQRKKGSFWPQLHHAHCSPHPTDLLCTGSCSQRDEDRSPKAQGDHAWHLGVQGVFSGTKHNCLVQYMAQYMSKCMSQADWMIVFF